MIRYEHEGTSLRIHAVCGGMSPTQLLSNQATFSINVVPGSEGELFALESPDYRIRALVSKDAVRLFRNGDVVTKTIGGAKTSVLIMGAWNPGRLQLAVVLDSQDSETNNACETLETQPTYVPTSTLQWARRFNLVNRRGYTSVHDFVTVLSEAFRQVERKIRDSNSTRIYWERSAGDPKQLVPRPEPQVMANISALLDDHSLVAGYQLIRESGAGAGRLDLRAIAPLASGATASVCIEGKHAHAEAIEHGVTDQLPEYMRRTRADFGIYLVLWFKCDSYNHPATASLDLKLALHKARPFKNMSVEVLDLGFPEAPSDSGFAFK